MAEIQGLGHSRKRVEDARFIRGVGNYIDDLKVPGMIYLDLVRSPLARAKIKNIDCHFSRSSVSCASRILQLCCCYCGQLRCCLWRELFFHLPNHHFHKQFPGHCHEHWVWMHRSDYNCGYRNYGWRVLGPLSPPRSLPCIVTASCMIREQCKEVRNQTYMLALGSKSCSLSGEPEATPVCILVTSRYVSTARPQCPCHERTCS